MHIIDSLKNRRTCYQIDNQLEVSTDKIVDMVETLTELVPDAFDMKSSRVVIALGDQQAILWDAIYDAFGGKVPREKIDSFKAGAGTILYFYDQDVVKGMQEQFPTYADNFPIWANQASGMLQLSIWSGLRELGVGASLQHYNPIIDESVRKLFNLPASYKLVAQMPFGRILAEPNPKSKEDISKRVKLVK
ncbi:MAG: nitroreductase family protein [Eubacteriales bacterium]|nr:nitroreductase family protein [Eubacteriales bacterium]